MTAGNSIKVRFWGVRGSIACPGHDTLGYGGNTSCVEMRCADRLFIFDGGTGLRELGRALHGADYLEADLFLSHTHYDHVFGLPFFGPFFNPHNRFRMWAGHLRPQYTLEEILRHMMTSPLFPVPVDVFAAKMEFHDFDSGDTLDRWDGVTIKTVALKHPNGATGYRVEHAGRAVCYVTDTEHQPGKLDEDILGLIAGADLLIYDATYTDDQFPRHKGWGHSTWQEGARLSRAAGVKQYAIFHHDPSHDDAFMDRVAAAAKKEFANAIVAREGMTLTF